MATTLVALYAVSVQPPRERFEGDDAGQANSSAKATGSVSDANDAETDRIDGMVFNAYTGAFGVPPSPHHSKYYAQIVKVEKMDESALKERIQKDAQEVADKLVGESGPGQSESSKEKFEPGDGGATGPEMDADMRALREKAARIAKMSGPVEQSGRSEDSGSEQLAEKLRTIAGQVSALARQYDVPLSRDKDAPKGIESFIAF